jgi:uncharacterized protein involved in exopolysaccharide biosynthesis
MTQPNEPKSSRDPRLILLGAFAALLAGAGAVVVVALLAHQVLK